MAVFGAVAIGLSLWVVDALLDFVFFYRGTASFPDILIVNPPDHEIYIRILILACFVGFGLVVAGLLERENEQKLAAVESAEKLSTTLRSIGDGVITTDVEGRVTRMNGVAEQLTGWEEHEARYRPLAEVFRIVNSATRVVVENPIERVIREGKVVGLANHTMLLAADGSEYQIADSAAPIRDRSGALMGVVLVFRDVTEEYELKSTIAERELRFRRLFESMSEGVALHEVVLNDEGHPADYRIVDVNPWYSKHTGIDGERAVGALASELYGTDEPPYLAEFGHVAMSGEPYAFETYFPPLDKHFRISVFAPAEKQFGTVFMDISEAKRNAAHIEKLNTTLTAIRDVHHLMLVEKDREALLGGACECLTASRGYSHAWVANLDSDGAIISVLESGEGQGFRRLEVEGDGAGLPHCLHDAVNRNGAWLRSGPDLPCAECPYRGRHENQSVVSIGLRHNGRVYGVLAVAAPTSSTEDREEFELLEELANDIAFAVHSIDLEDRRRQSEAERELMQERLRHAEKMEAIGQLAGGIAHDFNNQLMGIQGAADIISSRAGGDPELETCVGIMLRSSKRAADLTSQLLAYARKGMMRLVEVDLHEILDEVIALLERSIDKKITIENQRAENLPRVSGDASQLHNAILNLAINARDAMPDGGTLTFGTRQIELDALAAASVPGGLEPGPFVVLDVTDTGSGMPPSVCERVFEPFFTTKKEGAGTGLGLAAVYGTAKSHKGTVAVASEPGLGSTFSFYLPVSVDAAGKGGEDDGAPVEAPGPLRVLVVDDEESVRKVALLMLSRLGHRVATCATGAEAVEYYRRSWRTIDVVLLDMIMPEMSGREVFHALREINPEARIILSSGYAFGAEAADLFGQGASTFVGKPYLMSRLAAALAEVIERVD